MRATLQPPLSVHLSVCQSVGRSVGLSVGHSQFYFFYEFFSLTPKWSSDLKYGPCLPACDFGSHVSGLVLLQILLRILFKPILLVVVNMIMQLLSCFCVLCKALISALKPNSKPCCQISSLETQIQASRPNPLPWGPNPSPRAQIPAFWPIFHSHIPGLGPKFQPKSPNPQSIYTIKNR